MILTIARQEGRRAARQEFKAERVKGGNDEGRKTGRLEG